MADLIRGTQLDPEDVRRLMKQFDQQMIVTISVAQDGEVQVVGFGSDAERDRIVTEWVTTVTPNLVVKIPFQTAFGWGNGGFPKALTPEELRPLSASDRIRAKRWTR